MLIKYFNFQIEAAKVFENLKLIAIKSNYMENLEVAIEIAKIYITDDEFEAVATIATIYRAEMSGLSSQDLSLKKEYKKILKEVKDAKRV